MKTNSDTALMDGDYGLVECLVKKGGTCLACDRCWNSHADFLLVWSWFLFTSRSKTDSPTLVDHDTLDVKTMLTQDHSLI